MTTSHQQEETEEDDQEALSLTAGNLLGTGGKFELQVRVGTGATAVVWEATDTTVLRRVAMKMPLNAKVST